MYSVWPYFIIMPLFYAFVFLPFFRVADSPPHPRANRVSTLDGLRGFLALGVFFDHSSVYRQYAERGIWRTPPAHFYTMLGECGVSLFFMITGYLFWSKLIRTKGKPKWIELYIGRIFRIGPVYIVTIVSMIFIVFLRTHFQINDSFVYGIKNFTRWLSLGIFQGWDINGYKNTSLLLAFVTWTLYYEWRFYLSLLVISIPTRLNWTHLPFAILAFTLCLIYKAYAPSFDITPILISMFCAGMASASLEESGLSAKLSNRSMSIIVLLLLAMTTWLFSTAYSILPAIMLSLVFYLIVSGCSIFGLLQTRCSKRLGNISYGVYLIQGLVLNIILSLSPIRKFALESTLSYWIVIIFTGFSLISLATLAHVTLEQPGIKLGQWVSLMLRKSIGFLQTQRPRALKQKFSAAGPNLGEAASGSLPRPPA